MRLRSPENPWIQRTKWLTQALIISGALNIGLLATFVYFVLQDRQHALAVDLKPHIKEPHTFSSSNEQSLRAYSLLPYQELLLRLENNDLLEEGLRKRDIALSCLVAFHHFNLEKALGGINVQKRKIPLQHPNGLESIDVRIFPGLADFQFQAILHYAKTEKWPLTSQGLFYEMKRSLTSQDVSLLEAFYLSSEFHAVETLFSRSGFPIACQTIIDLLCEGDWKTVADLTRSQERALDFSVEKRRSFLLDYLHDGSPIAAELLLKSDQEFVVKNLSDTDLLMILDRLSHHAPQVEFLAKELLVSPRADAVWEKAASILYFLSHEAIPDPYDHGQALARFMPGIKRVPQQIVADQPIIEKKLHIVEVGDSLWKIARKYRVTVNEIMRVNQLESEHLRLGKQLIIPERKTGRDQDQ